MNKEKVAFYKELIRRFKEERAAKIAFYKAVVTRVKEGLGK